MDIAESTILKTIAENYFPLMWHPVPPTTHYRLPRHTRESQQAEKGRTSADSAAKTETREITNC